MSARELTCERCAKRFGCAVDDAGGCWCMDIALDASARSDLRRRFRDCLCRDCLQTASDNEKAGAEKLRPA